MNHKIEFEIKVESFWPEKRGKKGEPIYGAFINDNEEVKFTLKPSKNRGRVIEFIVSNSNSKNIEYQGIGYITLYY